MKERVDVWVVVRFDARALEEGDSVAIKGVYDSLEEANAAADRGSKDSAPQVRYSVVRSRRFPVEGGAAALQERHHARLEKSLKEWQQTSTLLPVLKPALRELAKQLPSGRSKRALQPLLSYYAELLVARALNAVPSDASSIDGDIRLPSGTAVEVKAVLIEPDRPKAPVVQFRSDRIQQLALVLFSKDLNSVAARLIPLPVLRHFERLGPHSREGKFSLIRITSDLLDAPGTSEIELRPGAGESPRRDVVIEEIKNAVHNAADKKQKIATFHLQVLRHAEELEGLNAKAFCQELAVPATYATEFRKMLSLARLMKAQGLEIA